MRTLYAGLGIGCIVWFLWLAWDGLQNPNQNKRLVLFGAALVFALLGRFALMRAKR
jgi:hypothetical protein